MRDLPSDTDLKEKVYESDLLCLFFFFFSECLVLFNNALVLGFHFCHVFLFIQSKPLLSLIIFMVWRWRKDRCWER